jgi:hypothetical protein
VIEHLPKGVASNGRQLAVGRQRRGIERWMPKRRNPEKSGGWGLKTGH